jgi:hypothetical protein
MAWLTGKQVELEVANGRIKIDPFSKEQVNPR